LCGDVRPLSKSHVPPQAAGNTDKVRRSADIIDADKVRRPGRSSIGGMWVRGLCKPCNELAGARYDLAYADFHSRLAATGAPLVRRLLLDDKDVPPVLFAPGLVARAVMFGMFALDTRLRIIVPPLAEQLLQKEPHITMPSQVRLKVARATGKGALLTSGIWRARVMNPRAGIHHFTFADIVFPPLAWALVPTHDGPLITDTWGDATEWLSYSTDCTRVDLRLVLRELPTATHPRLRSGDDGWVELLGDSVTVLGQLP
jgi:hypothetical protein